MQREGWRGGIGGGGLNFGIRFWGLTVSPIT